MPAEAQCSGVMCVCSAQRLHPWQGSGEDRENGSIVRGPGLRDTAHLASWFLPLVPPSFDACGIGFANFGEAYPTWNKSICVKG